MLITLSYGVYELNLPYSRYKTGGGFICVIFEENDIVLGMLDYELKNCLSLLRRQ